MICAKSGCGYIFSKDDVYISYLPLAHVMERVAMTFLLSVGARFGFYQGDTLKLVEDIQELKPTVFLSVPRLFNRVFDRVVAGVKSKGGLTESLYNFAYNYKKANLSSGKNRSFLWDKLVFHKVRENLGGKIRLILSGSAPLSPEVLQFLRIAFSCHVIEGYGSTETSATSTIVTTAISPNHSRSP